MTDSSGTWRAAVDPNSERTYYYNDVTKKTQWDKPLSLMEGDELADCLREKEERTAFFQEMERNVIDRMAGRYVAQGKVINEDEFNEILDDMDASPPTRTRTISTIDDEILSYIRKRNNSDCSDDAKGTRDDCYRTERKYSDLSLESLHEQYQTADHEFLNKTSTSSKGGRSPPRKSLVVPKLTRRNSTNTIFVNSTLSSQDNNATIECIGEVIRSHMVNAQKKGAPMSRRYEVFLDAEYEARAAEICGRAAGTSPPGGSASPSLARSKSPFDGTEAKSSSGDERDTHIAIDKIPVPTKEEIVTFFKQIFEESQLEGECIIMSLIYCEKLIKATKGKMSISVFNWKSILFACLVMSSKVWDDLSMWNCDFSNVCPSYNLQRVNDLELEILDILKYQIRVAASEYAKYYFHLRSMMSKLGLTTTLSGGSVKPLDLPGAQKLQIATERLAEQTMTDSPRTAQRPDGGRSRRITSAVMERPEMNRAASSDMTQGSGLPKQVFIGLEQLVQERHTDAGGQTAQAHATKK
jgi:hypothetical protein